MKSISPETRISDQESIAPWSSDTFNLEGVIDFTIDTKNTDLPNFTEFDKDMHSELPIQSEGDQSPEHKISLEEKTSVVTNPLKKPKFDRKVLNELQIDKENMPIEIVGNELSTQNILQCKICSRVLSSKYCLKKHYQSKHGMLFEEKIPVTMKPQIPEIDPVKNKNRSTTKNLACNFIKKKSLRFSLTKETSTKRALVLDLAKS